MINKVKRKQNINNRDYLRVVRDNDEAFFDYYDRVTKIATSIFVWKNLPDSMDADWLELCLFWYGEASFVNDKKYGHINTKCTTGGNLNIYGLPTKLCCYSYGYNKVLPVYNGVQIGSEYDQCIHILNNRLRMATSIQVERMCDMLVNADVTANINVNAQKTPYILLGDEKIKLTLVNLYNQIASNRPVIFGNKDRLALDSIKCIQTNANFVAMEIMDYKKEIWNELLTFLGINNVVTNKRERQIKDEVNANNELININLQNSLKSRQKACDLYNKKYNLTGDKKISVELNSDLYNVVKEALSSVKEFKDEFLDSVVENDLTAKIGGTPNE